MTAYETRCYKMLLRVRDFGNTHQSLFPEGGVAREAFAALATLIEALATADVSKKSASASSRADRKAAARKLLGELVLKTSQTARVLRTRGHEMPPFDFPDPKTDQSLLTAARQFARDAVPLEAAFVAHGLIPSTLIDAAAAFESAMRGHGAGRADHVAARARIQELFASTSPHLQTLDVIINNEMAQDPVIQTVWKRARRIDEARKARGANAVDESSSTTDVEAPSAAPGAGKDDVAA